MQKLGLISDVLISYTRVRRQMQIYKKLEHIPGLYQVIRIMTYFLKISFSAMILHPLAKVPGYDLVYSERIRPRHKTTPYPGFFISIAQSNIYHGCMG